MAHSCRYKTKSPDEPKRYYFHTDQIGTPLEVTDDTGHMVWRAYYKTWGALEALVPREIEQNSRFQGQYYGAETGLHYNTFRYYDPLIGRFTTQDPIGLLGGDNLYQYAPNTSSWIDPWGLSPLDKLAERGFTGVTQTSGGGLDYSKSNALYAKEGISPIVSIEYSGDYIKDFHLANEAAGLNQKSTPRGYVWHHLDDYNPKSNIGTMQLVKQTSHTGISHKGGVSQYKAATGKTYTFPLRKNRPAGAATC